MVFIVNSGFINWELFVKNGELCYGRIETSLQNHSENIKRISYKNIQIIKSAELYKNLILR